MFMAAICRKHSQHAGQLISVQHSHRLTACWLPGNGWAGNEQQGRQAGLPVPYCPLRSILGTPFPHPSPPCPSAALARQR